MSSLPVGKKAVLTWDPHRFGRPDVCASGSVGAYVHFPFCRRHCWYCDFNVHVAGEGAVADYLDALGVEIAAVTEFLDPGPRADTIYVGGGTPSRAGPERLGRLLATLRRRLRLSPGGEFTVEANPADASAEVYAAMTGSGVTRLSLGVQSFADRSLSLLDRDHTGESAARAVELAEAAGFGSISVDLIYGTPGQSLEDWRSDLKRAARLGVGHVSCYALTLDSQRTRSKAVELGRVPDGDGMFPYYQAALGILGSAGFEHYETSNWSRTGHRCRHNAAVWAGGRYLPLGCGAHGFLGNRRYHLVRRPDRYAERIRAGESLLAGSERLEAGDLLREAVALPLRTAAGIDLSRLNDRFGYDLFEEHGPLIEQLAEEDLLVRDGLRLRPSDRGMFLADALGAALLPGISSGR